MMKYLGRFFAYFSGRKKWMIVLAAAFLLAAFAALFWRALTTTPMGKRGQTTWVNIPLGSSTTQIAGVLEEHGVITNGFWFRVYLYITGSGSDLQAGDYRFASGLTLPQVVAELRQGSVAYNTVTVTIPEGYTVSQIVALLVKDGVCSKQSFMQQVKTGNFPYPFVPSPSKVNKNIRDRLEGYLFPDTYDFLRHEPAHDVINTMLQEMSQVLSPSIQRQMKREHLTVARVLTIASMIEREAMLNRERPIIASVIFNRLKRGMKLQIDSTVEYALGGVLNLTDADLLVNNPYNTYMHHGLPPGPIANPGLASIKAVLHPAHTDYYYYVAKFDGSGGHYFSRTFAQQLIDEAKSQRNFARYVQGASTPPHSVHKP